MSAYIDNLPDLSRGYCVLDCETTGLDPEHDRIIEVCLLIHQDGRTTARTSLVKSVDRVPEEIARITGITTEMLQADGREPAQVFSSLFQVPELRVLPVVGHNIIGFDWPFLLREAFRHLDRESYEARVRNMLTPDRLVDTGALYKGIRLGERPLPGENHYDWACRVLDIRASGLYWNLAAAAAGCGVPFSHAEPHRARADAVTCQRILERILEAGRNRRDTHHG